CWSAGCASVVERDTLGAPKRPCPRTARTDKVPVLPTRAANCGGHSHVVLQARQASFHGLRYEFRHNSSSLDPEPAIVEDPQVARCVTDNEAAKSLVSDQDVGSQAEYEVFDVEITCGGE